MYMRGHDVVTFSPRTNMADQEKRGNQTDAPQKSQNIALFFHIK